MVSRASRYRSSSAETTFESDDAGSQKLTPERRLYVAMIRRAVWDFVLYRGVLTEDKRAISEDAETWLFYDGDEDLDADGRVTFLYTCSVLNLDPERVRVGAQRLRRQDIQKLNNNIKED